ncbi:MAG: hypothetical protein M1457_09385 [bacterium]|nr:hypothetical protein [bacterium]
MKITNRGKHQRIIALGAAALAAALWVAPRAAVPQTTPPRPRKQVIHPFKQSDFVRGAIGLMPSTYYVGQPVVVPFVLSNHTRFPVTISTNFIPRSQVSVYIRPEGEAERQFFGPYGSRQYGNRDYPLYPLEEVRHDMLIWSDPARPTGLAFDKPGRYRLRFTIQFSVLEGPFTGQIPLGPVDIVVQPTPPEMAPLVAKLSRNNAFAAFEVQAMPKGWSPGDISPDLPPSPLRPYLFLAAGNALVNRYHANRDRADAKLARRYYDLGRGEKSAVQVELYLNLIMLMDELDNARDAANYCRELVSVMPADRSRQAGDGALAGRLE